MSTIGVRVQGLPLALRGLTKTYGQVRAVNAVDADVLPGRVTALLGPNGSGKTTTLRMLLGLARPDAGTALVGGRPYSAIPHPQRVVGASLEASFHPGRTGWDHLRTLAPAVGASDARIARVLGQVGLHEAKDRKVGGYSLGMRQRLALAGTLLGDPAVLVLDEPANGLDPQGIAWLRDLLRHLAAEGRTVLVSSHHLGEVQAGVDDVLVLSRGRLVHASSLTEMMAMSRPVVAVAGPDAPGIRAALESAGWVVEPSADGFDVRVGAAGRELSTAAVGHALFTAGLEVHRLGQRGGDLESTFLQVVSGQLPGRVRPLLASDERGVA